MIRKYHNNLPVYPLQPQYIYSTDDTVVYIYEGLGQKKEKFRLISTDSLNKQGSHSTYVLDNTNSMKGMRVKLTFTFSALGTCAPLFVSVTGLNERELPHEKCLILKIEGMCVGGGGVAVGS